MMRIAAELSSRGTIRVLTMAAIPIDEFIGSFKEKPSAAELIASV
jgi:uncharacterized protein with GYD domain